MSDAPRSGVKLPQVKSPIAGPGLKAPGVVLLQFLLIFLIEAFEYSVTKVGLFTGIAILASWVGGFFLGRKGSEFAAVVTPPLAFFIATVLVIAGLGGAGLSISHIGLDLVTMMSAAAPFLIIGALGGWGYYFIAGRKN